MAGVVVADHCAVVVAFSRADILVLADLGNTAGCAGHHLKRLQGGLGATHYDTLVVRYHYVGQWDVASVGDYVFPGYRVTYWDFWAWLLVGILVVCVFFDINRGVRFWATDHLYGPTVVVSDVWIARWMPDSPGVVGELGVGS